METGLLPAPFGLGTLTVDQLGVLSRNCVVVSNGRDYGSGRWPRGVSWSSLTSHRQV